MTFFPMISVFSTLMYKQKMYKIRKSNKHSVILQFGLIDKSVPLIQNNTMEDLLLFSRKKNFQGDHTRLLEFPQLLGIL